MSGPVERVAVPSAAAGATAAAAAEHSVTAGRWLEHRGIEPVPSNERRGSLRRIFCLWFAPNLGLPSFAVGTLAAGQFIGLGWWDGLAAIVTGNMVAALAVGILATAGPRTGTPQLAASRAPFGKAVLIPALVNWASLVGWSAVSAIFGGYAVVEITGGAVPLWLGVMLVAGGAAVLGILGFRAIQGFQTYAALALGLLFLVSTATLLGKLDLGLPDGPSGSPGTFVLMAMVAGSLNLAWAVAASDYTRYLPERVPARRVAAATMLGLSLSAIWLEALGLAVAQAIVPAGNPVHQFAVLLGGGVPGVVGSAAILLGTLSFTGMTVYSGSLSLLASGLRLVRPLAAAVAGILGLFTALALDAANLQGWFENGLLLLSYWIAAWVAIVLLEWLGRGGTRAQPLPSAFRALPPGVPALVAVVAGTAAAVPFMHQELYIGPVSRALGGADLGYLVSFGVSGLVFGGLQRWRSRLNRPVDALMPAGETTSGA